MKEIYSHSSQQVILSLSRTDEQYVATNVDKVKDDKIER